jgi:hypothetical protein
MRSLRTWIVIAAACGAAVCGGSGGDSGTAAAQPAAAGGGTLAADTLGTIIATVDGVAGTWYVVSGAIQGRPYASGLWQQVDADRRRIVLGGYETATPPLDTFALSETGMPRSYGTYAGSTMALTFEVGADPAPFREVLGSGGAPPTAGASVIYASPAKIDAIDTTFMMATGVVDVTAVSMAGALASATGTFSGTLRRMVGDGSVEIKDGRFEVKSLPGLEALR